MALLENLQHSIASRVPPGLKVYKDDCMYNFDNAENNANGLDVCLNCYQSYSRGDINYTKLHSFETGHMLYLNIRQILKPESERDFFRRSEDGERSPKVAKLEIKDSTPEELYNFEYRIYCAEDDTLTELNEAPAKFQELARSIIEYNSSNREEEIKAWEQEITACEHSIELQQFDNPTINLTQCSQCDLKENLWICLHCGALGCGRQQFGSNTPGNSHALKHFEDSEHPVAIKLGSLSATDKENYDAYCYQCNDEVKVPDLVLKLQKYGIDLDKTVKTEKNLIELNLDQNKNWDFGIEGDNGEKLEPTFGENLTGLTNLGNSCYLSSVVQSLFHLKPYLDFFRNKEFPTYDKLPNPANDLFSQLLKLYHGLVSGKYSKPNKLKGDDFQLGLKLVMLKSLIGKDHPEFKTTKQQDAFEFLLYFLDQLDKQLGLSLNEPFKFLTTNRILCSGCMKGRAQDELVDSISLSIEDEVLEVDEDGKKIYQEVNLLDSFKAYCEDEVIEGFRCDNCNQTTKGIKSCGFKSFPDYLIVNSKRIKLENWVPIKVDVPISVPETLDISGFKTETNELYEYASTDENKFAPNQEQLNTLLGMGFPENRAVKALYKTGNSNAEAAMNWLFEHMEDTDIDAPLEEEASSEPREVDQDAIANLVSMGFLPELSRKALILNGDPNAAVEWLFNNPDDDGKIEESSPPLDLKAQEKQLKAKLSGSTNKGTYKLKAVVCHKGTSPHTGHYVAFIRINDEWILFNDEKVLKCHEDGLNDVKVNGYVYFFERSD